MNQDFVIKTYYFSELAALYGVTVRTFKKEIVKAKVEIELRKYQHILMPVDVKKIVDKLGEP